MSLISGALGSIISAVKTLTPLGGVLGIGEKLAGIVTTAIDVGQNAVQRIEDGTAVAHEHDVDNIKAKIAELEAINDDLATQIENS